MGRLKIAVLVLNLSVCASLLAAEGPEQPKPPPAPSPSPPPPATATNPGPGAPPAPPASPAPPAPPASTAPVERKSFTLSADRLELRGNARTLSASGSVELELTGSPLLRSPKMDLSLPEEPAVPGSGKPGRSAPGFKVLPGPDHLREAFKNPPETSETPALPRVLLIGDSISIGYTVPVRILLQEQALVFRPAANCMHTAQGLARLQEWLGGRRWDLIHFNWGIWDTHLLAVQGGQLIQDESKLAPGEARIRHDLAQYREQLAKLVVQLKATQAKLVWASITPILSRKGERFEDIPRYNAAAAALMKENGVEVNDLYALALPRAADWQQGDRVHFNALGNLGLARQVAESIRAALGLKPPAAVGPGAPGESGEIGKGPRAQERQSARVSAERVEYNPQAGEVLAEGKVAIQLPDGSRLEAARIVLKVLEGGGEPGPAK